MNTMTAAQISAAKTSELVAFYNSKVPADKQIKKFADRATAEKRVGQLILDAIEAKVANKRGTKKEAAPAPAAAVEETGEELAHRTGTGDRRTGKRGTVANREADEAAALFKQRLADRHCPFCGGTEDITAGATEEDNKTLANHYLTHHACGVTYHAVTGKEYTESDAAARSAAIAASWADPEVAAARALRDKVKVGKETYRSVREAFKALGLPDSQHIKFRMELKAAGKAEFQGHKFSIVRDA